MTFQVLSNVSARLNAYGRAFAISLTILLAACSSKLAYNNLDWLVDWYLSDLIDLTDAQQAQFDHQVTIWHRWHRTTELTRYRAHLVKLKASVYSSPLTAQQWLHEFDATRQYWQSFVEMIAPDLVALSLSVSEHQLIVLFDRLEKKNQESVDEWTERQPAERQESLIERTTDRIENWIGTLTPMQSQIIQKQVKQIQPTFLVRLEYRRSIQAESKKLLLQYQRGDIDEKPIVTLWNQAQSNKSDQLKTLEETNRSLYANMLSQLGNTLTTEQKAHLDKEIIDLISDLDALIDKKGS